MRLLAALAALGCFVMLFSENVPDIARDGLTRPSRLQKVTDINLKTIFCCSEFAKRVIVFSDAKKVETLFWGKGAVIENLPRKTFLAGTEVLTRVESLVGVSMTKESGRGDGYIAISVMDRNL